MPLTKCKKSTPIPYISWLLKECEKLGIEYLIKMEGEKKVFEITIIVMERG